MYSQSEIDRMGSVFDHERDFLFTYAGKLRQVFDKYLVQDRSTESRYLKHHSSCIF